MLVVQHHQLELDTVQAAGGVDLVNSQLCGVGDSDAVNRGIAGQGAGQTDDELGVVCRVVCGLAALAGSQYGDHHQDGHHGANDSHSLFHILFLPFLWVYI